MKEDLNILILEDMPTDVTLIQRAVLKVKPNSHFTVATNEAEFLERLSWSNFDLILADYKIPAYSGLQALIHVRKTAGDLPFVFVTGSLNDDEAVARTILSGADGYILKNDMERFNERFQATLDRIKQQQLKRQEQIERNRLSQLKLQKAQQLLATSKDFPGKDIIQETLQELTDLL